MSLTDQLLEDTNLVRYMLKRGNKIKLGHMGGTYCYLETYRYLGVNQWVSQHTDDSYWMISLYRITGPILSRRTPKFVQVDDVWRCVYGYWIDKTGATVEIDLNKSYGVSDNDLPESVGVITLKVGDRIWCEQESWKVVSIDSTVWCTMLAKAHDGDTIRAIGALVTKIWRNGVWIPVRHCGALEYIPYEPEDQDLPESIDHDTYVVKRGDRLKMRYDGIPRPSYRFFKLMGPYIGFPDQYVIKLKKGGTHTYTPNIEYLHDILVNGIWRRIIKARVIKGELVLVLGKEIIDPPDQQDLPESIGEIIPIEVGDQLSIRSRVNWKYQVIRVSNSAIDVVSKVTGIISTHVHLPRLAIIGALKRDVVTYSGRIILNDQRLCFIITGGATVDDLPEALLNEAHEYIDYELKPGDRITLWSQTGVRIVTSVGSPRPSDLRQMRDVVDKMTAAGFKAAELGLTWSTPECHGDPYFWVRGRATPVTLNGVKSVKLNDGWHQATVAPDSIYPKLRLKVQANPCEQDLPESVNPDVTKPFKDRLGLYYELAGRYASHNSDVTLVHGSIQGMGKPRLDHAWVILEDGSIWEPIFNETFDADVYRMLVNPMVDRTYSNEQTCIHLLKHKHWGPWE
jgi:hypothetical protein